MKRFLGLWAACPLAGACSSSASTDAMVGGAPPASGEVPAGAAHDGTSGNGNGTVQAGILTAGAWDDNRNFDFYNAYLATSERALQGVPVFSTDDRAAAAQLFSGDRAGRQVLDIAFLLDVTGSMQDELSYLQREIDAIGASIRAQFPAADPRWGLVVYKDVVDEFTVHSFDFESDVATFKANLDVQSAGGGGDYEEAVEQGLDAASKLTWRAGDGAAKVVFWVADAPHHIDKVKDVESAITASRQSGVHIYPIAASGADARTESTMRSAAQMTGGRYLFLTNDSGVGNAHEEPIVPCYFVTKLDDALVRMVSLEMTGKYKEPGESEIIRVGGNPKSGRCTLEGGQAVSAF